MPEPWHELPLRLVTPAFLGHFDATDQKQAIAPFPVPSLRGVLAYWLRALAGAHVGNDTERLHDVEAAVFGAAKTDTSGGQSPIQLRAGRVRLTVFDFRSEADGLRYLMGPGLTASTDQPPRFLAPGAVSVRVRNLGSAPVADLFLGALWALRTFGGIGARTRRGFGTLALSGIPQIPTASFDPAWMQRDHADDLAAVIGCVGSAISELKLMAGHDRDEAFRDAPLYPCFAAGGYRCGSDAEDQLPGTAADWRAALDTAGTWLWGFRHGASRRLPGSQPAKGTHTQSYNDVIKPYLDHPTSERTQKGPLTAAALGLPIPYSDHQGPRESKDRQRKAVVDVLIDGHSARRASPLWLRVRRDQATWRLRSLAFYNEWLPPSPRTHLQVKQKASPPGPIDLLTAQQVRAEIDRWFDD
jgi:hypothetical protein